MGPLDELVATPEYDRFAQLTTYLFSFEPVLSFLFQVCSSGLPWLTLLKRDPYSENVIISSIIGEVNSPNFLVFLGIWLFSRKQILETVSTTRSIIGSSIEGVFTSICFGFGWTTKRVRLVEARPQR